MKFQSKFCLIAAAVVTSGTASAQTYPWLDWSSVNATTVSAAVAGDGLVRVSTSGAGNAAGEYSVLFDGVAFTPVAAQAAALSHSVVGAWSFTIDVSGLSDTSRLVVGIGNLGYGDSSLPGYSLASQAVGGGSVDLSTLAMLGSHDFFWTVPSNPTRWDDNLSLDTTSGAFAVVAQGTKDFNSDMLLFRLPAMISTITIASNGAMSGDSVNVMVAALPVPEPATSWLWATAGLVLFTRRRFVS